ncbi:MAG: hypothetical protein KIS91_12200 [Anaerolineae bacterium]|nr:hypothetical protein [Anaerolineae bacterium]
MEFLTRFDGKVSHTADGRTLREYTIIAQDVDLEAAAGIMFPPGHSMAASALLRATEGDLMRVRFANAALTHSLHCEYSPANMDGVFGLFCRGTFSC